MNRKHPEWIPRDGHAWLGWTGLDLGGGDWVGGWESSWTESERQKGDREKERERPWALTGVALHSSWGLTADLDLWIFLCLCLSLARSLSLPPPVKTHASLPRVTHMTRHFMFHHVHYSSFNMASRPTRLHNFTLLNARNIRVHSVSMQPAVHICFWLRKACREQWFLTVQISRLHMTRSTH